LRKEREPTPDASVERSGADSGPSNIDSGVRDLVVAESGGRDASLDFASPDVFATPEAPPDMLASGQDSGVVDAPVADSAVADSPRDMAAGGEDGGVDAVADDGAGPGCAAGYRDGDGTCVPRAGVVWTRASVTATSLWCYVASSADGTKLVAAACGGYLYTSGDSGATWMQTGTSLGAQNWASVASSSNGTKLVAVAWPA
jgi:hypothetical protein